MHFPQIHGRGWKNNLSGTAPQSERFRQMLPYQGQRRRPPPVAETGRSCWGSGQQDASGARRMLGAATRPCRAKQTERLYEGEPDRHANGSPFGGAGERSETERARPLTANPRHSDSIALTKSLPIAAQRLFPAGLALSVIASQCHLSQRERLWQAASFPVSFWRKEWYNGFAVHPAYLTGEEVDALAYFLTFLVSVGADVVSHFICKWLDRCEENRKA